MTRKLKRRLGVGCGVWGVGCGVWGVGCGHAPVGGDGGDEEDRADEGENIFQSSLPSSPCPSPTRAGLIHCDERKMRAARS